MSRFFIYVFIIFGIVTSSIIFFFSDEKKEEIKKRDINVERSIQKEINKTKSDFLVKEKMREEKKKVLLKKDKDIKSQISKIDKLVLETEKLVNDNNLTINDLKENQPEKEKIDKLNNRYRNIKKELEEIK